MLSLTQSINQSGQSVLEKTGVAMHCTCWLHDAASVPETATHAESAASKTTSSSSAQL